MTRPARLLGLPALAAALVGGVLAVQLSHGGGPFEPLRPADACVQRSVTSLAAVDAALKTDDVLTRAIEDLDVRQLLTDLNDRDPLDAQVRRAVTQAVQDAFVDRLRNLL